MNITKVVRIVVPAPSVHVEPEPMGVEYQQRITAGQSTAHSTARHIIAQQPAKRRRLREEKRHVTNSFVTELPPSRVGRVMKREPNAREYARRKGTGSTNLAKKKQSAH